MKIKFLIFLIASAAIGVMLYAFTGQTQYDKLVESYNELPENEKTFVKEELTTKLKNDPIYKAYEKLCNEQYSISLESAGKKVSFATLEDLHIKFKSEEALTRYYQKAGISKPKEYGRLEVVKMLTLVVLSEKYPELTKLPRTDISSVLTSARTPLKVSERLKNEAIFDKALRENLK